MSGIDETSQIAFYNNRPAIRVGGGVLIFNQRNELLIIKPTYRNTWAWPGGGCNAGESPGAAAKRECEEEIGRCPPVAPAFVNYIPPQPDGTLDVLHFVFIADTVLDGFSDHLVLSRDEIEAVKFVPVANLIAYMKEYRVRAVETYLRNRIDGAFLYLEDGLLRLVNVRA
jgi:8-oxo-dGTP pyrophosphatase MutT (NUDIX family)